MVLFAMDDNTRTVLLEVVKVIGSIGGAVSAALIPFLIWKQQQLKNAMNGQHAEALKTSETKGYLEGKASGIADMAQGMVESKAIPMEQKGVAELVSKVSGGNGHKPIMCCLCNWSGTDSNLARPAGTGSEKCPKCGGNTGLKMDYVPRPK